MSTQTIRRLAVAGLIAAATVPGQAAAQSIGSGSSSSIGGGSSSIGGPSSIGSGIQSGNAASPDSTQLRATEGDSTINSSNVDAIARSGNIGTSSATTFGSDGGLSNSSDYSFQLAPNPGPMPRLPSPKVGIDLGAIRAGLDAAPSATPDAAGN